MPESNLHASDRGDGLHLLVVIPCLDEAPTVGRVVAGVPRDIPGIERVDIVVLDDGSSDATGERAREAGAEVVRHHTTRGLGATFQEAVGIAIARNVDVLLHIDGDGQFDPGDIPLLVKPVVDHDAHMATASRFLDRDLVPTMPAVKRGVVARIVTGPHEAHRQDPHLPMRYDTGRPRAVIRLRISQPRTTSFPCPAGLRARRPSPMMDL